jgi:hypothetical protein
MSDGSFVTISDVEQSFHQTVPEGGSAVALLGIALAVSKVRAGWSVRVRRKVLCAGQRKISARCRG